MKTMKEQLQLWREVNTMSAPKKSRQKPEKKISKRTETFTDQDLRYLMNSSMKTLRRGRGGAYKYLSKTSKIRRSLTA
ncbi:hypothetical protein M3221_22240 [Domibacillus indicus]|jgi:hypothetical protein|uniref:hypothetical protein n=1 Tax=Domibacillus indicus TaxID=1437523 RepID=UPI0020400B21|nr:hypothetical protein [Domibacillus indicus]MCM3791063.1 hypothetical protein [Domibacillus indicus]